MVSEARHAESKDPCDFLRYSYGELVMAIKRTRDEVSCIIEQFLDGTGGKWAWDNFCSIEIADDELDRIRILCAGASETYPPTEKGHYCSADGLRYLRNIANQLRAGSPLRFS